MNAVDYAVDVGIVETVVERGDIQPVPTPLSYLRGAMDIRGRIVPVVDLKRKFGISEQQDTSVDGIVVVFSVSSPELGSRTIGALVDEVSEVLTIDDVKLEEARAEDVGIWEKYVHGVIRMGDRMIVVVEPEAMFSVGEIEELKIQ
jgi:purine-binding chemotaxis protein CheW